MMEVDPIHSPAPVNPDTPLSASEQPHRGVNVENRTSAQIPAHVVTTPKHSLSHIAENRFPLTASLSKHILENGDARVVVPEFNEEFFHMPHYNSRGELIVSIDDLPLSHEYMPSTFTATYESGYYFVTHPAPLPTASSIPSTNISPNVDVHTSGSPSLQRTARSPYTVSSIRLCKTQNCNAILPINYRKRGICARCYAAAHPEKGNSPLHTEPNNQKGTLQQVFLPPKNCAPESSRSTSVSSMHSLVSERSTPSSMTTNCSHPNFATTVAETTGTAIFGKKRQRPTDDTVHLPLWSTAPMQPAPAPIPDSIPYSPSFNNAPTIRASPQRPIFSRARLPSHSAHPTRRTTRQMFASKTSARSVTAPTSSASSNTNVPDPNLLRLAAAENRGCITASCPNIIPSSCSPFTLRCPSCVREDWLARKASIEKAVRRNKRQERHHSDSTASIGSMSSLSNLTSLGPSSNDKRMEEDASLSKSPDVTEESNISNLEPPIPKPEQKLVLKFPAVVWHMAKTFRYCADNYCWKRLDEGYDKLRCVCCRARERERKERFGGSRMCVESVPGAGDAVEDDGQGETIGEAVPGARLCAVRWCSHVLPAKAEYKWSMCLGCRGCIVKKGSSDEQKNEMGKVWGGPLTFERSGRDTRRCASLDCGWLVKPLSSGREHRLSLCFQCIRRRAREMERVERYRAKLRVPIPTIPEGEGGVTNPTAVLSELDNKLGYREYCSIAELTAHFRVQLLAFLQDQAELASNRKTIYEPEHFGIAPSDANLACEPVLEPTTSSAPPNTNDSVKHVVTPSFTFTGQFSTVSSTPNLMHLSHRSAILSHIVYLRSELERVSFLCLKPQDSKEPLVAFKEGFAVRFGCIHSIPLEWFLPGEGGTPKCRWEGREGDGKEQNSAIHKLKKDIKGELDVILVANQSHSLLPGQTTLVRFRMGFIEV